MVFAEVDGVDVFVGGFEEPKRSAIHLWVVSGVGSVKEAVLVLGEEFLHEARDGTDLSESCADIGIEVREFIEHGGELVEIGAAIGQVAGDDGELGIFLQHARQGGEDFGMAENVRFFRNAPFVGIHQAVVVLVHRFIHPLVFADVDVDGQAEFSALGEDRIEPGIVTMHAVRPAKAGAFVAEFPYPFRAGAEAALEFGDGALSEIRLVNAGEVEAAPKFKACGMFREERDMFLEFHAAASGKDNGALKADVVHDFYPAIHAGGVVHVDVGVNIDDRELGAFDAGLRDVEDGARFVVLEKELVGRNRLLGKGG